MGLKIIVTFKLGDRNAYHFLDQIAQCDCVDSIYMVRDTPIGSCNKVISSCPPKYLPPLLKGIVKFLSILRISVSKKTVYIHGYLLSPHGYLAFCGGKLTRRKVGVSLIAGPAEMLGEKRNHMEIRYSHPFSPLPLSMKSKLILRLLRSFDIITVTGTYTKNALISAGIDKNKIYILPHTVDDRFYQSPSYQKEYDLLSLGRLSPEKHIETFIKSVAVLVKTLPNIHTVIVGDGKCMQPLKQLAASLGLTDANLLFAGYQTNVWEWYNRSRISVISSEREGFPYTAIESLKCGVPVITSNCGDICDVVKDGYNGHIIQEYDDVEGFAQAILGLLQDEAELGRMTENAVPSVASVTHEKVCEVWDEILRKVSGK